MKMLSVLWGPGVLMVSAEILARPTNAPTARCVETVSVLTVAHWYSAKRMSVAIMAVAMTHAPMLNATKARSVLMVSAATMTARVLAAQPVRDARLERAHPTHVLVLNARSLNFVGTVIVLIHVPSSVAPSMPSALTESALTIRVTQFRAMPMKPAKMDCVLDHVMTAMTTKSAFRASAKQIPASILFAHRIRRA